MIDSAFGRTNANWVAAMAMKARIGQVLYWAGCIISAFLVMVGLNSAFYANSDFERFVTLAGWLVLAGVAYLIARTVRHVLAGI